MPRQLPNWLTSWETYLNNTESPHVFRFWSGVSILAASLKRNIIIQRGQYEIPPHMYIIYVAGPGIGKGEVITPAKRILEKVGSVNIVKDATNIFETIEEIAKGWPTNVTTTANVGGVVKVVPSFDHTALIAVNELPTFMNAAPRTMDFINAMWDQNTFDYKTKNSGCALLRDFNVNLAGGCVPEFIHKINQDSATETVTGGFSSRCIFVYGKGKGAIHAWPPPPDKVLEKQLVDDLVEIGLIKGDVMFSSEATRWFEVHYVNFVKNSSEFDSLVKRNFRARYVAHTFKLALILTIAQRDWFTIQQQHHPGNGAGHIIIGRPKLEEAVKKINDIISDLDTVFANVGEASSLYGQDRVLCFLDAKKSATYGQIALALRRDVDPDTFDVVLSSLLLTDPALIEKATMPGQGTKEYYSLTKFAIAQRKGLGVP